ncbi:hypothetical protein GUJ93_ZPchr0005g16292 [Zizania palustris]|uniref:Uncharacterized protein n=1 Tax=Zizania palustris TaxID=103762 RepID=A0A8J5S1W0_ZIZPA|nr:hypothetical protein GUJ93_ZPchr0005g16292 [Zizania palustris]
MEQHKHNPSVGERWSATTAKWADGLSGRRRTRFHKEVLLAGESWTYNPPRGKIRTKRKGHKCNHISAEKMFKLWFSLTTRQLFFVLPVS